jgi:hypothetical protein
MLTASLVLSGCYSDYSTPAVPTSIPTAASTACDLSQGCTPTDAVAMLSNIYEQGGATPKEAACLARVMTITQPGEAPPSPIDDDVPTADELAEAQAAAAECVGSAKRLQVISLGVADYMKRHPNAFPAPIPN